jgi:dienelactone hydrolase
MRTLDFLWLTSIVLFAFTGSGPVGVISLGILLLHIVHKSGAPRLQLSLSYPCALYIIYGVAKQGLKDISFFYQILLTVSVLISFLFDFLLPITVPIRKPSGARTNIGTTFVQVTNHSCEFTLRIYFPLKNELNLRKVSQSSYLSWGALTTTGIARFMNVPSVVFSWLTYIPTPNLFDADPVHANNSPLVIGPSAAVGAQPIAVFSHGLGGCPDVYLSIIQDMVSHGYVVLAPEHADGSCSFTAISSSNTSSFYIPLSKEELGDRSLEFARRTNQLSQRAREISATIDWIEDVADLASGPSAVAKRKAHRKQMLQKKVSLGELSQEEAEEVMEEEEPTSTPASSDPSRKVAIEDKQFLVDLLFPGQVKPSVLDLDHGRVVLFGHSFGGATVIKAGAADPKRVCGVVALDPWAFPLDKVLLEEGISSTPILSLSGDRFSHWKENCIAMKLLFSKKFRSSVHSSAMKVVENDRKELVTSASSSESNSSNVHDSEGTLTHLDPALSNRSHALGCNGVLKDGSIHAEFQVNQASPSASSPHPIYTHPSSCLLTLTGSQHQSYSDFALTATFILSKLGMIGTIDPTLGMDTICQVTRQYFEFVRSNKGKKEEFQVEKLNTVLPVTTSPWE